jgi:hypothetical protein
MSDYFSTLKQGLGDAVERRAHLPWYSRLRLGHGRALVVVVAALVVATPAVGAVSGWFSFGKPNAAPPAKPGFMFGLEKPGSSRLLPLRIADPEGGPPWGLRLVKTSRDDTCVQLGRVEDGQIGSLGIDDAWKNDDRFHTISPKDDPADQCGSTDAAGYGYVNRGVLGKQASANPTPPGCRLPQYLSLMGRHGAPRFHPPVSTSPGCPAGAGRVVFFGLLGPDATSVTYRTPGGSLATERTAGGVGAYLLVFPYTEATCDQYSHSASRAVSCDSISLGGVSPGEPGAVTKITYKDGHSCSLVPPARLEAAYKAFTAGVIAKLGRPKLARPLVRPGSGRSPINAKWLSAYRALMLGFLAREHLTMTQFRNELGPVPSCPAVGWVATKGPKITAADVATPIVVRELPTGSYGCPNKLKLPDACDGLSPDDKRTVVPVEWSFKARRAVTNSRSWYEWSISPVSSQTGTNCGGSSFATYTNVHQGQTLRYSQFLPTDCRGKYTISVGYTASAPPGQSDDTNAGGGGSPGHDGSILVGTTSFTIP